MALRTISPSRDDVVELTEIEDQKENIQPLASGRSAKALHALITSDRKALQDDLRRERERFRSEIEQADKEGVDDPLDIYHRFVRWTLSSYPAGHSHNSELIPLLEEATRRFVHEEQYKADIRLLKLWLLYAKYVDYPRSIFRFLEGLQVGVRLATFYEEWAVLEEQSRDFASAHAVYNLGIARKAQPLERLKKRRDAFLARAAVTPAELQVPLPVTSSQSRSILGESTTGTQSRSAGAPPLGISARPASSKNGATAFAVFCDDANGGATAQSAKHDNWTDFGTQDQRRKENVQEAGRWKGETMPQQTVLKTSTSSKIEVFRDDDAVLGSGPPVVQQDFIAPSLTKSLRGPAEADLLRRDPFRNYTRPVTLGDVPSLEAPLATTSITAPKRKTMSSSMTGTVNKPNRPPTASTSTLSADETGKRADRVASPIHDIYPDGATGPEFSFEEIMAEKRGLRAKRTGEPLTGCCAVFEQWQLETRTQGTSWRVDSRTGDPILRDPQTGKAMFAYVQAADDEEEARHVRRQRQAQEQEERAHAARLARRAEQQAQQAEEEAQAAQAEQIKREDKESQKAASKVTEQDILEVSPMSTKGFRPPSPTINTKAALAEVNAMFGKTMRFDDDMTTRQQASDSDSDTEASFASSEDEDHQPQQAQYAMPAAQPFLPSQAETDDGFWSQRELLSQEAFPRQTPNTFASQDSLATDSESEAESVFASSQDDRQAESERISRSSSSSSNDSAGFGLGLRDAKRTAFRPVKPNLAQDRQVSIKQPAFQVFQEEQESPQPHQDDIATPTALEERAVVDFFDDDATTENATERLHSVPKTPSVHLGRRIGGDGGFASNVNIMTPILERTCEFGSVLKGSRSVYIDANLHERPLCSEASLQQEASVAQIVTPPADADRLAAINPLSAELIEDITNRHDRLLKSMLGFHDLRHHRGNRLDSLQKTARSRRKSGHSPRNSSVAEEGMWEIELGSDVFSVREKLGEGGYGAVFRIVELLDANETLPDGDLPQIALKVESPANIWEFYALNLLHRRLDERARLSIVKPYRLYAFEDETHMLVDYCDQGTLLDAVNHAQDAGVGPTSGGLGFDETLAMFFVIELMRTLEAFHHADFLHCDFKVDNCLLRLQEVPGGARNWSNAYKRDGTGGWSCKGISMIDFGRTVDLQAYERGQTFSTKWTTNQHDCTEMAQGRPWTYQPDYFGLACITHVLLFGKYLETTPSDRSLQSNTRFSVKEPLKRYHQIALWTDFFEVLLNPCLVKPDGSLPVTSELSAVRARMEDWLEANCEKGGKSLKHMLKKLEIQSMSR